MLPQSITMFFARSTTDATTLEQIVEGCRKWVSSDIWLPCLNCGASFPTGLRGDSKLFTQPEKSCCFEGFHKAVLEEERARKSDNGTHDNCFDKSAYILATAFVVGSSGLLLGILQYSGVYPLHCNDVVILYAKEP